MSAPLKPPNAKSDPVYKQTVAGLARSLADFKAQQQLANQQYDTSYNQSLKTMGWNPNKPTGRIDPKTKKPIKGAFDRAQGGLTAPNDYRDAMYTNENDFAGRGGIYSGAYATSVGNIGQEFGLRKTLADTARGQAAQTRASALSSFKTQQQSVQDLALMDALSRIASKYGIEIAKVPGFTAPK